VVDFLQSSDPNSLWMVYKWEGLRPLSMYSAQAQTPPAQAPMFSMFRRGAPGDSPMKRATKSFLRFAPDLLDGSIAGCSRPKFNPIRHVTPF
jgi:hypothetical protein